jgi:peptidoglycan/xylan/chitin deacetylase (PgdA/CDA1 family)
MRSLIKKSVYGALRPALLALSRRQGVIVGLCGHRFESARRADPKAGMAVTADVFRRQLEILHSVGSFVSVDEAVASPPTRGVRFMLCFDDGYRDNATILLPILQAEKIPCCVYVVTGLAGGTVAGLEHDRRAGYEPPALAETEVRDLSRDPLITIGSHTVSHRRLGRLSRDEMERELVESKRWLESCTGRPVVHFAAPFGQRDDVAGPLVAGALAAAGYRTLASNFGGVNLAGRLEQTGPRGAELFHLRRVPLPSAEDSATLLGWVLGLSNLRERLRPQRVLPPP